MQQQQLQSKMLELQQQQQQLNAQQVPLQQPIPTQTQQGFGMMQQPQMQQFQQVRGKCGLALTCTD
eukprot:1745209-Amphidinium_carterae.1